MKDNTTQRIQEQFVRRMSEDAFTVKKNKENRGTPKKTYRKVVPSSSMSSKIDWQTLKLVEK